MTAPRRAARPLVSVIVPVHDRLTLARRALESVYAQSHRPIEAIVVDDASSPPFGPPAVVESKGVEVCVRRMDANGGPGAARETGRRLAKGDYLAYLDSDDAWHPDHVSGLLEAIARHPDAGMAWAPAVEMRGEGDRRLRRYNDEDHDRILPAILWGRPWHTSACLWRRSLTDAIGPWMPLWNWEDYEYDCRAGVLPTRIVRADTPTCYVGCNAPDRQSDLSGNVRGVDGFCRALFAISRQLADTEWNSDAGVRDRMRALLLSSAAQAAEAGLTALAAEAVHETRFWSSGGRLSISAYAGVPMLRFLDGRLSARIFRWARRLSRAGAPRPAAPLAASRDHSANEREATHS